MPVDGEIRIRDGRMEVYDEASKKWEPYGAETPVAPNRMVDPPEEAR